MILSNLNHFVFEDFSSAAGRKLFHPPVRFFFMTFSFRVLRWTSVISIWLLAVKVPSAAGVRAAAEAPAPNL